MAGIQNAEAENETPILAEEIVVSGNRYEMPASEVGSAVTVIAAEEIERRNPVAVLDLLRTVPGAEVTHAGGPGKIATVRVRGGSGAQALVLVDGYTRPRGAGRRRTVWSCGLPEPAIVGPGMVKVARAVYRRLHAGVFAALRRLGWNVARTADFYSPLPVLSEVAETRELWDRPNELVGVRYDLEAMKALLSALVEVHGGEFEALPPHSEIRALGYGPGFPVIDALTTYLMVRDLRPARYVEIGSGLSTYYAWLAAAANGREGSPCEMTCIDPFPYRPVAGPGRARREGRGFEGGGDRSRASSRNWTPATCCSSTRRTCSSWAGMSRSCFSRCCRGFGLAW